MRTVAPTQRGDTMPFLIKLLSNTLVQQLVLQGLEALAKRSDNTIDNKVVEVVRLGLNNRIDPVKQVAEK